MAQPLFCRAAFPLENAGASRRAIAAFLLPAAGHALRGSSDLWMTSRQPAPGGQPVLAAGRSPDAARVRGLLATPADADPLHTSRRNRFASLMGADNYRDIIL